MQTRSPRGVEIPVVAATMTGLYLVEVEPGVFDWSLTPGQHIDPSSASDPLLRVAPVFARTSQASYVADDELQVSFAPLTAVLEEDEVGAFGWTLLPQPDRERARTLMLGREGVIL